MKILLTLLFVAGTQLLLAQAPNSWTEKNAIGTNTTYSTTIQPKYGAFCFMVNNKAYIGTGSNTGDVWEYDPATNLFTQKSIFGGTARHMASAFSIGSKGYVGLGRDISSAYKKDLWEYNPSTNAWTQKADFGGTGRYMAVGFAIGTKGYMGTGSNSSGNTNDFWEYDPATNAWVQKANVGGAVRNGAVGFSIGAKGYIGTGANLADFWEYNPVTDSWLQRADFGGGIRSYACAFATSTKGYIATGIGSAGIMNDFWEFDPVMNLWTQKANSVVYREAGVGFVIGNKGYIGTGRFQQYRNDILEYDFIANTWTQKINPNTGGRRDGNAFSIGDKGFITSGAEYGAFGMADLWEFSQSANSWIQKPNFPGTARDGGVSFTIGKEGYFLTGGIGFYSQEVWVFNPATNAWSQKANLPGVGRKDAAGFSIGNKGYIGTGFISGSPFLTDFWEYDSKSNTWLQKANFAGVARVRATGFSIGNKGYIGLGATSLTGGFLNDVWEYNPASDSWTQKSNYSTTGRANAVAFVIGSKAFVGTGENTPSGLGTMSEYDPATNVWTARASLATGRYSAVGMTIGTKGYIATGRNININFNDMWEYTPPCVSPDGLIFSSGNTTFCSGDSVFLYANLGYNYQWKKDGINISGENSYFIYAKTVGNYTCELNNSCGTVVSSPVTVSLNSTATVSITPAGPIICTTAGVELTANVTGSGSIQWTKDGVAIPGAVNSTYTPSATGVYRVEVTNGCGTNVSSAVTENFNIAVSFTGLNSSYTTASAPSALTGNPSGGIFSGPGVSGNQFNPASAGAGGPYTILYTYTGSFGCISTASAQTVVTPGCTIAPATPGTITAANGTTACPGDIKSYSIVVVSGATSYLWTAPAGSSVTSGQGTTNVSVTYSGSFTINDSLRVVAINACGTSAQRKLSIKLGTKPSTPGTITSTSGTLVCPGESRTYSISPVANTLSYNWIAPSGSIINSGQGTTSVNISFTAAFAGDSLRVEAINNCGVSAQRKIKVNRNNPTTPGTITATNGTIACPGDVKVYSISNVLNATGYNWIPPSGAVITSGQGTTSVNVTYTSSFLVADSLRVVSSNACGTSAQRKLKISRNNPAVPSVITGSPYGVCNQSGLIYSVNNVSGITYNWWFDVGNASIVSGQGTNSMVANYDPSYITGKISVTGTNGCGTSVARTLIVKSVPAKPVSLNGSLSVCANQQGVPYSISPLYGAATYTWTGPAGSTISDGSTTSAGVTLVTVSPSVTVNFGSTAGIVKVSGNNACGSGSYLSATVAFVCREGIANSFLSESVLYPNPGNGEFVIELNKNHKGFPVMIRIMDSYGKLIESRKAVSEGDLRAMQILRPGIYSIEIVSVDYHEVLRYICTERR